MSTKDIADGLTMPYTAPTSGGHSSGDLVEVGDIVGIVYEDIAAGAAGTLIIAPGKVYSVTKPTGVAFTQGQSVYLTTAGVLTTTPTANQLVGIAWEAASAAAGATTVNVILNTRVGTA